MRNQYRTPQYRPSQQFQHVKTLVPEFRGRTRRHTRQRLNDQETGRAISKVTTFPTALTLAAQLATSDPHLASALALARERDQPPAGDPDPNPTRESSLAPSNNVGQGSGSIAVPNPTRAYLPEPDLSDTSSNTSAQVAISNPPIPGDPVPSVEQLFARVNSFAKSNGFGVIKANGAIRPGRRSRYAFQCDRYGTQRPTRGAGLRKRKSRKAGCKWKITAESLPENGFQWTLRHFADEAHHQHNHRASADAAAHPVHRRLTSPVKSVVQLSSRQVGIRARDIGGIVRGHFPESVFTQRDIYNARAQIHREQLGGYSSTAALIKLFDEKDIPYVVQWAEDEPDRLVGLVWTLPYCIRMWRRFSEVISFDNTYNTNRFKLPLFQVTGQTCLGSVFNAAFGLIDNERLEGFRFLAYGVRALLDKHDVRPPDVIITDFDKQMKRALEEAFADAQQQLCIHHINSNVLLQGKRRWVYSSTNSSTGEESSSDEHDATLNLQDRQAVQASERPDETTAEGEQSQPIPHDYHGVLVAWKQVVFAETEMEHEKAWEFLCKQFGDQRAILAYLCNLHARATSMGQVLHQKVPQLRCSSDVRHRGQQ